MFRWKRRLPDAGQVFTHLCGKCLPDADIPVASSYPWTEVFEIGHTPYVGIKWWSLSACQDFRLLAVDYQANLSSSVFECSQQFLSVLSILGNYGEIACKVKIGDLWFSDRGLTSTNCLPPRQHSKCEWKHFSNILHVSCQWVHNAALWAKSLFFKQPAITIKGYFKW